MANGYFETGMADDIAYFDMFFRRVPDGGGYAIMAGVEQMIDYLRNLKFTDEDIEYLRGKTFSAKIFCSISENLSSSATYGQFRKELRYSLTSLSSPSEDR